MKIENLYFLNSNLFRKIDLCEITVSNSSDFNNCRTEEIKNSLSTALNKESKVEIVLESSEETKINLFDKCVINAIFTLVENGILTFSIKEIMYVLSLGKVSRVTNSQKKDILKSIDKLRHILLKIDLSCDALIKDKELESCFLQGFILPITLDCQNDYCRLTEEPCIFTYSKKIKQVINIEINQLKLNYFHYSTDNIVLLNYLILRIQGMKCKKNKLVSNKIMLNRFDKNKKKSTGLYYELGYLIQDNESLIKNWRNKKKKINIIIREILSSFRESGFIKDYKELYGIRNTIQGYELSFTM